MITILATSQASISRRLATRSTTSPAGSATSKNDAVPAAVSNPTWNVDARNSTTAASGSATAVTAEPISLTDCPPHSSMKSRCRQRLPDTDAAPPPALAPAAAPASSPSDFRLSEIGLSEIEPVTPEFAMAPILTNGHHQSTCFPPPPPARPAHSPPSTDRRWCHSPINGPTMGLGHPARTPSTDRRWGRLHHRSHSRGELV